MSDYEIANPKPAALIESLRSIGYNLPTAVADIIDNSITARATKAKVDCYWSGRNSWIAISDNGEGMSEEILKQAMRPGSENPLERRSEDDLGRFGLGLKTASFSQARRLTVFSRRERQLSVREWDLDYVEKENEWRLLTHASPEPQSCFERLDTGETGTILVWTKLDRLTGGENTADAAAHSRFNDAIDHIRGYLSLIFHRFIEEGRLAITVNELPIQPWNPFLDQHPATYKTPVEKIPFAGTEVEFRGFILPHKDKLNTDEYLRAGGIQGWTAHQGFYIYRNGRLLVFGDWLRLGNPRVWTRDERSKLARIRLDIGNDTDGEWQLDVKKSKARPPALIRSRLTDLAAKIRTQARSVFAHRGHYGPNSPAPRQLERPWKSILRDGRRCYAVNREHPLVKTIFDRFRDETPELETLLRLLEETVPVEQIWLDTAEQVNDRPVPYDGVDLAVLRADLRKVYQALIADGTDGVAVRDRLRLIEPFNRYTHLIAEL